MDPPVFQSVPIALSLIWCMALAKHLCESCFSIAAGLALSWFGMPWPLQWQWGSHAFSCLCFIAPLLETAHPSSLCHGQQTSRAILMLALVLSSHSFIRNAVLWVVQIFFHMHYLPVNILATQKQLKACSRYIIAFRKNSTMYPEHSAAVGLSASSCVTPHI